MIWNASLSIRLGSPENTSRFEFPIRTEEPGLYTVVASATDAEGKVASAQLELPVSATLDRWQIWRRKLDLPNKTHLLLAFYYPWYGTPTGAAGSWIHWEPEAGYASTHVPLIGFYDSSSPEVISYHIRCAQSVGIDGFICSWWGPDNYIDDAFAKMLDLGQQTGFKLTIYLEIARGAVDLYRQLRYVLTRYGPHPAFLRYSGKPVIFIYSRVIGALALSEFAKVFSELESEGLPGFYLADKLDLSYLQVFDGLHTYSPLSSMNSYPELSRACAQKAKIFAATIAPGYDDTVIRHPGLVVDRANGSYYMAGWEMVIISKPQWVLLTSWNEWHEGSEIEPSLEFGDLYLNLTATYNALFESGRLTPRLEVRVNEISWMFAEAIRLIAEADAKGMDTRLMKRDYSIAQKSWDGYEYEVTKAYLERILAKRDEIPERGIVMTVCPFLLFLRLATARRSHPPLAR